MNCSESMAPDDEALLAHVLGEQALSESGKHHLEHCPTCQQRLKDYQRSHELYRSQLFRVTCPAAWQLTLYCAQALSTAENLAIAEHLRTCSLCGADVKEIRREMALFTPFPGPPATFLQQATREVRRIVASLLQPPAPASALRELSSQPWPRSYQADDLNLSLHLARAANNQAMLLGIFLASEDERIDQFEGAGAELYVQTDPDLAPAPLAADEPARQTTVVDRLGHFSFAPVRPGTYTLRILLPDRELVVEQVQIEE